MDLFLKKLNLVDRADGKGPWRKGIELVMVKWNWGVISCHFLID
jgi:hypothetical protein